MKGAEQNPTRRSGVLMFSSEILSFLEIIQTVLPLLSGSLGA
ncbi:hypothetical protein SAMN04490220_3601 [Rhodococcus jostii]|uniref:Uncharacterized protein n=1 Tax=Rhodococcus jostii TaxID=132919 RepID=A0A1H4Y6Y8_RHOJO|nr:hypothetical protein SAMN04490220_3601 [Rhodococcus jostii]